MRNKWRIDPRSPILVPLPFTPHRWPWHFFEGGIVIGILQDIDYCFYRSAFENGGSHAADWA